MSVCVMSSKTLQLSNDCLWKNLTDSRFINISFETWKIGEIEFFSTFFSTWVQMSYWWKNMDVYVDGRMVPIQINVIFNPDYGYSEDGCSEDV